MTETNDRNRRKAVIGVVTSIAMDKTITVKSERRVKHPVFHKIVKRYTTYKAHDEQGDARPGDTVELTACRPMSKTKRFRLTGIVRRGKAALAEAQAEGGES